MKNTPIPYRLVRSRRRTVEIQITSAGEVVVRCPTGMSRGAVQAVVEKKQDWILSHLPAQSAPPFTPRELEALKARAREILSERVAYYAPLVGVDYGSVTIRAQRTRWGSCSARGNLNFNCLLVLAPPEVVDYVVVHELCHRREMNHGPAFWMLVEGVLPDYQARRQWLNTQGRSLIARLGSQQRETESAAAHG